MRPDLRSGAGFTLIESVVAMAIALGGLLAVVAVMDQSRRLTSQSERQQAAAHWAERELDRVLELKADQQAHVSVPDGPADAADTLDTRYGVDAGAGTYDFQRDGTALLPEPFAIAASTGLVSRAPAAWNDTTGRIGGSFQTFVTSSRTLVSAKGVPARRITVVVTVGGPEPLKAPIITSTLVNG